MNLIGYDDCLVDSLQVTVDDPTYDEKMYKSIKQLINKFTKYSKEWGGGYISDINDQTRIITVRLYDRDIWNDSKDL
jgi:phage-related tail protein